MRASFWQGENELCKRRILVIYKSKDGRDSREFDSLDFIASLASHIPNMGEQTVRYFGLCKALHKPNYAELKIMLS
ncbi:MAG: transposase [Actinobacteria bacterium]|nr:transposase [Actinomycetota bacterium]